MSTEVIENKAEWLQFLLKNFQSNIANEAIPRLCGIELSCFDDDREGFLKFVDANLSFALEGIGDEIRKRLGMASHQANINVGCVYFVQVGCDGPVKIGFTRNLKQRLSALQTSQHEQLNLLGILEPATMQIERSLHIQFAEHRRGGEWFSNCEELQEYIANNTRLVGVDGRLVSEVVATKIAMFIEHFDKHADECDAADDVRTAASAVLEKLAKYAAKCE